MQVDVQQIKHRVAEKADLIVRLQAELSKTVVGQQEMISRLLVGLLTHGHVLLEGVPGLAKTTAIKSLAQALSTRFQRIQFTPDLLPADLIGTMIYVPGEGHVPDPQGSDLRQLRPRRRNQSRPVQGAVGPAGGHAGAAGHDRRPDLPARWPVPGDGHAEPHRAGGHLPAARGPGRSLHAQSEDHLSGAAGGAKGARPGHGRHRPAQSSRCFAPRDLRHAGGGEADLRRRPGEGLYPRPGPGHPRAGRASD